MLAVGISGLPTHALPSGRVQSPFSRSFSLSLIYAVYYAQALICVDMTPSTGPKVAEPKFTPSIDTSAKSDRDPLTHHSTTDFF